MVKKASLSLSEATVAPQAVGWAREDVGQAVALVCLSCFFRIRGGGPPFVFSLPDSAHVTPPSPWRSLEGAL